MTYLAQMLVFLLASPAPGDGLVRTLAEHGWGQIYEDPVLSRMALEITTLLGESQAGDGPESAGGHLRFVASKYKVSDQQITPMTIRHQNEAELLNHFPKLINRLERRFKPTHFGIGQHRGPRGITSTILLIHRGFEISNHPPSQATPGDQVTLSGQLRRGYFGPRLIVSPPSQAPMEYSVSLTHSRFLERVFPLGVDVGKYEVELVANSQYGPVVLNQWSIYMGHSPPRLPTVRVRPPAGDTQVSDSSERLLSLINAHRVAHGLAPLTLHEPLSQIAEEHAQSMRRRNSLSHVTPDSGSLVTRLKMRGVSASLVAENLAEANDEMAAFKAFKDSPGHAQNLLIAGLDHVGIGVSGRYFSVALVRLNMTGKALTDPVGR